jgi:hypothetical protein
MRKIEGSKEGAKIKVKTNQEMIDASDEASKML